MKVCNLRKNVWYVSERGELVIYLGFYRIGGQKFYKFLVSSSEYTSSSDVNLYTLSTLSNIRVCGDLTSFPSRSEFIRKLVPAVGHTFSFLSRTDDSKSIQSWHVSSYGVVRLYS